jgi:hypothetical protein
VLKKLTTSLAIGALAITATAATAGAVGPPASAPSKVPAGVTCQQQGISTLQALDLLPAVAKGGIEVAGVGVLPFRTVLELHRTMPELFQTGGVSVVVPGVGTVPATWCDAPA